MHHRPQAAVDLFAVLVWVACACLLTTAAAQRSSSGGAADGSNNTDCTRWLHSGPAQDVVVGSATLFRLDASCSAALGLDNALRLTLYCMPSARVHLDGWVQRGGFVKIVGPPDSPWAIANVSIVVTHSEVLATAGPAVGVLMGAGGGSPLVRNVTLLCDNSTLVSSVVGGTANAAVAAALSFVVDPAARASSAFNVAAVSIIATRSSLRATADGGGGVAVVAAGLAATSWTGSIVVSGFVVTIARCSVMAAATTTAGDSLASVGAIVVGSLATITLENATFVVDGCNATSRALSGAGVSFAAASVSGIAVVRALNLRISRTDATLAKSDVFVAAETLAGGGADAVASVAGIASGIGTVAVEAVTLTMRHCNVTSLASSVASTNSGAVSTVAGVACTDVMAVSSAMMFIDHGNVTSTAVSGAKCAASAVAGSASPAFKAGISATRLTLLALDCALSSYARATKDAAASTVVGVAAGNAFFAVGAGSPLPPFTVTSSRMMAARSVLRSGAVDDTNFVAASSVAGVAVSHVGGGVMDVAALLCAILWSNATSSTSTHNDYGASAVGGFVAGGFNPEATAPGTFGVSNVTFFLGWTNATSTHASAIIYGSSAASVGGIATGNIGAFTVANATLIAVSINGTATCTCPKSRWCATSVASVAAASHTGLSVVADCLVAVVDSVTLASTTGLNPVAASVGGVAISNAAATVDLYGSNTSVLACISSSGAIACNNTVGTGGCCNAAVERPYLAVLPIPPELLLTPFITATPSRSRDSSTKTASSSRTRTRSVNESLTLTLRRALRRTRTRTGFMEPTTAPRTAAPLTAAPFEQASSTPSPPLATNATSPDIAAGLRNRVTAVPSPQRGVTVAVAFLASLYGSAVVASALSPTAANKPQSAARAIQAGVCATLGLGDGDGTVVGPTMPADWDWAVQGRWSVASSTAGVAVLGLLMLLLNVCCHRLPSAVLAAAEMPPRGGIVQQEPPPLSLSVQQAQGIHNAKAQPTHSDGKRTEPLRAPSPPSSRPPQPPPLTAAAALSSRMNRRPRNTTRW